MKITNILEIRQIKNKIKKTALKLVILIDLK